jgi:hypothetical protein
MQIGNLHLCSCEAGILSFLLYFDDHLKITEFTILRLFLMGFIRN